MGPQGEEAVGRLADVLTIAGLGDAIDRRVRTYSRGMSQRLAIAQAMLGMPGLLVLDEPMNGLDPPQIREMRDVLLSYAAGGKTVILSSHLLGEVEQTCSHVVVMSHGGAVGLVIVSDIVDAVTALIPWRQILPTYWQFSWLDVLQPQISWGGVIEGAAVCVSYALVLFALAFRRFAAKDIVS